MPRRCFLLLSLATLVGCTKPQPLEDIAVRSASAAEFSGFRAELARDFPPERLAAFDTAVQELKLEGMARDLSAPQREQAALAALAGKTVHEAEILGWQARQRRFLAEIGQVNDLRAINERLRVKASSSHLPTDVYSDRIRSTDELLSRLHRGLEETERQLQRWGAPLASP